MTAEVVHVLPVLVGGPCAGQPLGAEPFRERSASVMANDGQGGPHTYRIFRATVPDSDVAVETYVHYGLDQDQALRAVWEHLASTLPRLMPAADAQA